MGFILLLGAQRRGRRLGRAAPHMSDSAAQTVGPSVRVFKDIHLASLSSLFFVLMAVEASIHPVLPVPSSLRL